jgi:HlyD family secretion protein
MTVLLAGVLILPAFGCEKKVDTSFVGSGTIETTEVTVSAQTRGELTKLAIEEGDTVSIGNILAEIDVKEIILQRRATAAGLNEIDANSTTARQDIASAREGINQARITLENAQVTRDRIAALFQQGAATRDRLDQAETALSLAQSRLNGAKTMLAAAESRLAALSATRGRTEDNLTVLDEQISKGVIVSPAGGTVIEKLAEQGEVVNFGTPICTIADLSTVWLMVYVGEESIGKVKLGQKAHIHVDAFPDRTFDGTVTWISPKAEFTPKNVQTRESRADLVYAVKITLPNPEGVFKIGMPAEAGIEGL